MLAEFSAGEGAGSGMDELSLAGPSAVCEVAGGLVRELTVDPSALGLKTCALAELRGGDRTENAAILTAILDGTERGPRRDIVAPNAAAGFLIAGLVPDLPAGLALAIEQIDTRRALAKLHVLQRV